MTAYALVEDAAALHLSSSFYVGQTYEPPSASIVSEMVTDRGFYAPGDSVHLKGYLRSVNQKTGDITAPSIADAYLSIHWRRDAREPSEYPVKISKMVHFNNFIYDSFNSKTCVRAHSTLL